MTDRPYTIRRQEEECGCGWCGCPLETGDRAYPAGWGMRVYCGARHRTRGELHHARKHKEATTPGTEPHSTAHRAVLRLEADERRL